jgi:D-alanine-D-alanine ligase-like ATP-grasp enzyme
MLNAYNKVPEHRNNCYEIYGFDVLLDKNLKVYLIECNVCPSLSTASKLDK